MIGTKIWALCFTAMSDGGSFFGEYLFCFFSLFSSGFTLSVEKVLFTTRTIMTDNDGWIGR